MIEGLNIETATKQDVFDFVAKKLKAQGKPAYDNNGGKCLYRGPEGTKCAAGHLLPDAEYDPKMEGQSVGRVAGLEKALLVEVPLSPTLNVLARRLGRGFLCDIQGAHDAYAETGDGWLDGWTASMRRLANEHSLSPAVFDV